MTRRTRIILAAVTMLLAMVLIVGGIITGKHGAVVVGLCVATAAAQQGIVMSRQSRYRDKQSHDL